MHTVLIIDDSDINLTLIKALVLKMGECMPVLYNNPLRALDWCREHVPDLVIVDYMTVSYTHLDGYKRQELFVSAGGGRIESGGAIEMGGVAAAFSFSPNSFFKLSNTVISQKKCPPSGGHSRMAG